MSFPLPRGDESTALINVLFEEVFSPPARG